MKKILIRIVFLILPFCLYSQIIDMDSAIAEEAFRNGVDAFHNGSLNKADFSFEQALARKPSKPLYSLWLAETYYRNGYNSAATEIWQQLVDQGYQVDILSSRIEQVRRMVIPRMPMLDVHYAISKELQGESGGIMQFAGPVSVCPDKTGGLYSTSYVTGEILHFDANGVLNNTVRNGVLTFNRIFDLYPADDGSYFASEFGSNQVIRYSSDFSKKLLEFGETGRGDGQFNGPQFITQDEQGYIYVSDVGNSRICKFTREGEFILSFGDPIGKFQGFRLPTGLSTAGEILLVADQMDKVIYLFDTSGNYLGETGRGKFFAPEGITRISENEFLVADGERLVLFDLELESVNSITDLNGMAKRIVKSGIDLNGNIIVSDFNRNSLYYLTDKFLIYSGLYMQVEHVINEDYPDVYIDFTVKDSLGRPFCGLQSSNFLLTENSIPIADAQLVYSDVNSPEVSISLLIDRSSELSNSTDLMKEALHTLFSDLLKGDYFALISEENQPIMQNDLWLKNRRDLSKLEGFFTDVLNQTPDRIDNGRFDLGVRESVNRLMNRRGKKAVIYLTDGELDGEDFKEYNLTRISNFLKNNEIIFYYVQMVPEKGEGIADLEYLAKESGGQGLSIFSPTGVKDLVPNLRQSRNGRYMLKYSSPSNNGYGKNYLEFNIELTHFNRTGRTVFGYYAPLVFGK